MRVVYLKDGKTQFKSLPKTWLNLPCFDKRPESVWNEHGFYKIVEPVIVDPATQKKGEGYLDGNVYTYAVIDKSPEELEQEKIQKQKIAKEKIKQEKLEQYVKEQVNLDPFANKEYFDVWTEGAYDTGVYVNYKDKLFRNDIQGNTNAPDKGGWTEIKA